MKIRRTSFVCDKGIFYCYFFQTTESAFCVRRTFFSSFKVNLERPDYRSDVQLLRLLLPLRPSRRQPFVLCYVYLVVLFGVLSDISEVTHTALYKAAGGAAGRRPTAPIRSLARYLSEQEPRLLISQVLSANKSAARSPLANCRQRPRFAVKQVSAQDELQVPTLQTRTLERARSLNLRRQRRRRPPWSIKRSCH